MSRRPPWVLGARSETGYVRTINEDRMAWMRASFGDVFVVCDGMGGQGGGDIAAQIAIDELQQRLAAIPPTTPRFTDHVREAFAAANKAVFERRRPDDPSTVAMGTTGAALVTDGNRFIAAHIGDSRIYLWRRGRLQQLTRDHSHVQAMLDDGLLTPGQAAVHPDASLLTRAIGHQSTVQADVTDWIALEPGDGLLLCSDGLSGYVTDAQIAAILAGTPQPQAATDALVKAALDQGGHDNVTVQLVRFIPSFGVAIKQALTRPAVLLPACVGFAVAIVGTLSWELAKSDRRQIATLTLALAKANARAESAVAQAHAAVAAASRPASAPLFRPSANGAAQPALNMQPGIRPPTSSTTAPADTLAPTAPVPAPAPAPNPAAARRMRQRPVRFPHRVPCR